MKHLLFIMAITLLPSVTPTQAADDEERRAINVVIDAIDDCNHWIGEGGEGDEQRSAQIAKESARFCSKAQQKAETAYKKYPNNPELAAHILELIDIHYFTATGEAKNAICSTATTYFKTEYISTRYPDIIFRSVCPNNAASIYGK